MSVSASLVNDLRKKIGAGMMDCKKALVETSGDLEAAIDWLRTKGLATATKKAGRVASEGLTALAINGNIAAVIEVNSETDFVSRNATFQNLVRQIVHKAINCSSIEQLKSTIIENDKTVEDLIIENITTIGENLNLRRMQRLKVTNGIIASYVHNATADRMGKISVLVSLESTGDKNKLMALGKQLAMHVAATKPLYLNKESVDPALIQKEKDILIEQSRASGKTDNIIEKMIEGRIRKFLEEIVLLDQIFVIDGKSKISEVIANASKELGSPIVLANYAKFELGEGIEKEITNFANEVNSVAKN